MTVGVPGSGKTTRAIELEAQLDIPRLSLDAWMIPIFAGINDDTNRDLLEGLLVMLALQTLRRGSSVILDFGLWGRDERSVLRWLAGAANANAELIYMKIDRATQLDRVTHRYASTPEHTWEMTQEQLDIWWTYFQEPTEDELTQSALDDPPSGFATWADCASSRWPSFRYEKHDEGPGVRLCTNEWITRFGAVDAVDGFEERLRVRLYQCALEFLAHGVDVMLDDVWFPAQSRKNNTMVDAVATDVDIVELIQADHADFKRRLPAVTTASDAGRKNVFEHLVRDLLRHSAAEDEIIWAEVRRSFPDGVELSAERDRELQYARDLLEELKGMDSSTAKFDECFGVFQTAVVNHTDMIESRVLPRLSTEVDATRRRDMARGWLEAKVRSA